MLNELDSIHEYEAQVRQASLMGDIITKLDKVSIQQEKLNLLRKFQKQREKQQILSERIEADTIDE